MFGLTVQLIGIITVVCLGNGNYDCGTPPYKLEVLVPDATSKHHPCAKDLSDHEPTTPVHYAFIRIETTPVFGTHWDDKEVGCDDNTLCTMYPLQKGDVIEIEGISDGATMDAKFEENPNITWKDIYAGKNLPPPTLAADAASRAFATMLIAGGTWKVEKYGEDNLLTTTGRLNASGNVTISIKGTNRKIIVPKDATVDIINFPPNLEFGDTKLHVGHPHQEHFFIHYTLADPKPDVCVPPEEVQMNFIQRLFHRDRLVGSLACSNSNYP